MGESDLLFLLTGRFSSGCLVTTASAGTRQTRRSAGMTTASGQKRNQRTAAGQGVGATSATPVPPPQIPKRKKKNNPGKKQRARRRVAAGVTGVGASATTQVESIPPTQNQPPATPESGVTVATQTLAATVMAADVIVPPACTQVVVKEAAVNTVSTGSSPSMDPSSDDSDQWYDAVESFDQVHCCPPEEPAPSNNDPAVELIADINPDEFLCWLRPKVSAMPRNGAWIKMLGAMVLRWLKEKDVSAPSAADYGKLLEAAITLLEPSQAELSLHKKMENPEVRAKIAKHNEALRGEITTFDDSEMNRWCWEYAMTRGVLCGVGMPNLGFLRWREFARRVVWSTLDAFTFGAIQWLVTASLKQAYMDGKLLDSDKPYTTWVGNWVTGMKRVPAVVNVFQSGNAKSL